MLSTKRKRHEEENDEIVSYRDEIAKINSVLDNRIEDSSRNEYYANLLN